MSTLQVANIYFTANGSTQINLVDKHLSFKLGSNTNILSNTILDQYSGYLSPLSGATYPSNSYIVSSVQTAPSGWTEVTGTGYPAPFKVYKKN